MTSLRSPYLLFCAYALAILTIAMIQSLSVALGILTLGVISAIMALGNNIQWGYAGLLNVGTMGFAAIGGATAVWIAAEPVPDAWRAGGKDLASAAALMLVAVACIILAKRYLRAHPKVLISVISVIGIVAYALGRPLFFAAVDAIEAVDPAMLGFIGGLGAPIMLAWIFGALIAAGAAWLIGKVALGLRADYLAIATLGIAEILVAILKNEDWLTRGVKNVTGLPRPVPYEVDLVRADWVVYLSQFFGVEADDLANILVRLSFCTLFIAVLLVLTWLAEKALRAPWGRMMRAVRDNETAARAMGKDVTRLHLQVFVLGSAIVGLAGAMLVTLDGQFTPGTYQPLRFTFLIWVMVIVGGSGNNWGAILGGLVIWMLWVEAEPIGTFALGVFTSFLPETSPFKEHLMSNAAQMRVALMGLILLLALRFSPNGMIPEKSARSG
ncbi:branched-chain amino acid ABC transporter permease [Celeribacter sp. ULVN23_4]